MMSHHQHLDTYQDSSLSDEYNRKRHFIRARADGRFYENLVCTVLIIGSEFDIMKKSFITRESIYVQPSFRKKISVIG